MSRRVHDDVLTNLWSLGIEMLLDPQRAAVTAQYRACPAVEAGIAQFEFGVPVGREQRSQSSHEP
jgi:hypothetical protein